MLTVVAEVDGGGEVLQSALPPIEPQPEVTLHDEAWRMNDLEERLAACRIGYEQLEPRRRLGVRLQELLHERLSFDVLLVQRLLPVHILVGWVAMLAMSGFTLSLVIVASVTCAAVVRLSQIKYFLNAVPGFVNDVAGIARLCRRRGGARAAPSHR